LAIIIRIVALFNYGDFWFDEMFSFIYSQKPWADTITYWLWETNPPLHLLILKIWFYLLPANELWARIPSLIFGIANVYVIYLFAKNIFNKNIAVLCALLLALHPYHVFVSVTARGYSLLILLTTLSLFFFFKIFVQNQTQQKNKIIFAFINVLLAYTHLTSVLILLGQLVLAILLGKPKIKSWIKINIIGFIVWLLWIIPSLFNKFNAGTFSGAWFLHMKNNLSSIFGNIQLVVSGPISWPYSSITSLLIISGLIWLLIKQHNNKQNHKQMLGYLLIISCLPLSAIVFWGLWNIRFLAIIVPIIIITLAIIINNLTSNKIFITTIVVLLMLPGTYNNFKYTLPVSDWKSINNYVQKNQNTNKKQILIYNLDVSKILFDRYYLSAIPTLPFTTNFVTNWDEQIIKGNYIRVPYKQTEIDSWIEENKINNYDEIFLLQNNYIGKDIAKSLQKQGWQSKVKPIYPYINMNEPLEFTLYAKN